MKNITYTCDIKDCGCEVSKKYVQKTFQVIFTTEQTEGRSCEPYLDRCTLDICEKCYQKS